MRNTRQRRKISSQEDRKESTSTTQTKKNKKNSSSKILPVTTGLDQLPYCIFHLISDYLEFEEYRNFMNTSIEIFEDIKRETVYYDLNTVYSQKYASDNSFRTEILKRVARKGKQISIDFGRVSEFSQRIQVKGVHRCRVNFNSTYQNHRPFNMDIFSGIEELCLIRLHRVQSFEGMINVRKLHIEKLDNLTNVSALSYLHTLSIINCPNITNANGLGRLYLLKIEKAPLLTDITALGKGNHTLSFIDCPLISDVSNLGNVHSLTLIRCPLIEDITKLVNVVNLNITDCPEIRDLRGLGKQTTIILGPCRARDYSMLKDVRNVVLISCDIDDLSFLARSSEANSSSSWSNTAYNSSYSVGSSREITSGPPAIDFDETDHPGFMLLYCEAVRNVSYLQHLYYVTIGGNSHVDDISMLGNVGHLCIFACPKITSLQGLGKKNRYVEITDCESVTDFSPLQNVHFVDITSCNGFTKSEDLMGVHHVTIDSCAELSDVSGFSQVHYLRLIKCEGILRIENLHNVPIVEIKQCPCLFDINGLGGNEEVLLESCNRVSDVTCLKHVKKVKILRCFQIDDVSELRKTVPILEFEPAVNFFSLGFMNIFFM
eukprot:gene1572-1664_t